VLVTDGNIGLDVAIDVTGGPGGFDLAALKRWSATRRSPIRGEDVGDLDADGEHRNTVDRGSSRCARRS